MFKFGMFLIATKSLLNHAVDGSPWNWQNLRLVAVGLIIFGLLHLTITSNWIAASITRATAPSQSLQEPARTAIAPTTSRLTNQFFVVSAPLQFRGKVVEAINPVSAQKVLALTFDDGPWLETTEQVLDILQKHNVKATFFWVGAAIQRYPEIAQKVAAAGHAIGNHTWQHPLDNISEVAAAEELGNTAKLIYETTGIKTALMRPPGGNLAGGLVKYAKRQHYTIVNWSVDSQDCYVAAPLILQNVLSQVKPGDIVLLHDGGSDRSPTIQALPQIITTLQRQGYQFVTVPELLAIQAKK